jgi:polyisoprenoid-binding protein YceI
MSTIIESVETIPAGTWRSDSTHSSVAFAVVHNGLTPFRGGFGTFEATLEDGKLVGTAQHPLLRFESREIRRDGNTVVVDGDLTLRGVTKPVELRGDIAGPVADAFGNTRVGLDLATTVDRTTFGIDWNAPLPSGENLLANDVEITAQLQLVHEA